MISDSPNHVVYKVYGKNLATTFDFSHYLVRTHEKSKIDVYFDIVSTPPIMEDWKNSEPAFIKYNMGKRAGMAYRVNNHHILCWPELADYYVTNNQIYCQPKPIKDFALLETRLLKSVLSYWLELTENNNVLHASCVEINGKAVAFLADSKGGKSTLAAAFVSQGYPLITDDILRIRRSGETFHTSPGYPAMNMWPESAEYFVGARAKQLETVSTQTSKLLVPVSSFSDTQFCVDDVQLDRVYLPFRFSENADTQTTIQKLSPSDSLFELLSKCFAAEVYSALGKQVDKFQSISALAEKVPVKRIRYPNGFEYLPDVVIAVLEDINSNYR